MLSILLWLAESKRDLQETLHLNYSSVCLVLSNWFCFNLLCVQIRDFEYSPEAHDDRKKELQKLMQDLENMRSSLLQWCYASYGEVNIFAIYGKIKYCDVEMLCSSLMYVAGGGRFCRSRCKIPVVLATVLSVTINTGTY